MSGVWHHEMQCIVLWLRTHNNKNKMETIENSQHFLLCLLRIWLSITQCRQALFEKSCSPQEERRLYCCSEVPILLTTKLTEVCRARPFMVKFRSGWMPQAKGDKSLKVAWYSMEFTGIFYQLLTMGMPKSIVLTCTILHWTEPYSLVEILLLCTQMWSPLCFVTPSC